MRNRRIVLKSRPAGMPVPDNFELVESPIPELRDGEFLIRHEYLGLAPAARIRMGDGPSYAPPTPIGDVIYGQAAGQVAASRHRGFREGDRVVATAAGWQEFSVSDGTGVTVALDRDIPLTVWLGALGVSGLTAYVGLLDIGAAQSGETVIVSAASGGVGAMVGQIARIRGCRVIGVAGGPEKCAHVRDDLRFDACLDHRDPAFGEALAAACPQGADVYFDNVGGKVRDAALERINGHGRIVVCGLISEYNDPEARGPNWIAILTRRLTVRGFLMRDHVDRKAAFEAEMAAWYKAGLIHVREDVVEGLDAAPAAFIRMLQGRNFGKTIVKLT